MRTQADVLRALVASGGCPALRAAAAARRSAGTPGAGSSPSRGAGRDVGTYDEDLTALWSLPITTYDDIAGPLRELLDAMRRGAPQEELERLASRTCGEVPLAWGMTSGTTGAVKYYPITQPYVDATLRGPVKGWSRVLRKVPLHRQPSQPGGADSSLSSSSRVADAGQDPGDCATSGSSSPLPQRPAAAAAAAAPSSAGGDAAAGAGVGPTRHRALNFALAGVCEELPGGQLLGSVSSVFILKFSKLGAEAEQDDEGRSMACHPPKLHWLMTRPGVAAAPRYYALWLCAAAEPGLQNVTLLHDLFAGNLLTAVSVLQAHWRDLLQDLAAGRLVSALGRSLPPAAVAAVDAHIVASPAAARAASAAHLQRVMSAHEAESAQGGAAAPLLSRLMPLRAVLVVTTGSHGKFVPALRQLIGESVPLVTGFFAGTEGFHASSMQLLMPGPWDFSEDPTNQRFVMLPALSSFFEFLPVPGASGSGGRRSCSAPRPLTWDEVQLGCEYELLVTTFTGHARLRIGDTVRVEGWLDLDTDTCLAAPGARLLRERGTCADSSTQASGGSVRAPVITFRGRTGALLNLVWEKYDEGQLLLALSDTIAELLATRPSGPGAAAFPGLADSTVEEDIRDEAAKHYSFYWELCAPPDSAGSDAGAPAVTRADVQRWAAVLNAALVKRNTVYGSLLAAGQITPAVVHLVRPGTFRSLKEQQVAARGISPSQFKTPSVVAAGGPLSTFLRERLAEVA